MNGVVFTSLRFPRDMRSLKELTVRANLNAFFLSAKVFITMHFSVHLMYAFS